MKKLSFELEFITPAFIGDANQQAELRPASFVGLIRWWWRALKCISNTESLYQHEVSIFGGHTKDGALASKVRLKLSGEGIISENFLKQAYRLEWVYDKKDGLKGRHAGVGYLLYSMNLPEKKENFLNQVIKLDLLLLETKIILSLRWQVFGLLYTLEVLEQGQEGAGETLTVCLLNPK